MGKGIFVTGTDTGVGKTVIAGCLAAFLVGNGKKVAVYKPVQCGNLLTGKIRSPDIALVKRLSGIPDSCLFNDYCFACAASPHLAARMENKAISPEIIKSNYKNLLKRFDYVLVEGAGGLSVPLTKKYSMLSLIKDLNAHVIVVARSSLGTINHTSLALMALKASKARILGVIFNYYKGGRIEDDNKSMIPILNQVPVIGTVPFNKNLQYLAAHFREYVHIDLLD